MISRKIRLTVMFSEGPSVRQVSGSYDYAGVLSRLLFSAAQPTFRGFWITEAPHAG